MTPVPNGKDHPVIELLRTDFLKTGIFGELADAGGNWMLYTLEHSYGDPNSSSYIPKLPIKTGEYLCVRGKHQLKSGPEFETFEITGVAGHKGIVFHPGNDNSDSDGCVCLGLTRDEERNYITNSKKAFEFFMEQMTGIDVFNLIVT